MIIVAVAVILAFALAIGWAYHKWVLGPMIDETEIRNSGVK